MTQSAPKLWLSPTAFAKIIHMMDKSSNECGSFGICPDPNRPFYVSDFVFPKQEVSTGKVDFNDGSVAEFQERMDNLGLQPFQYMRVWQHCHPGNSPQPSGLDESTLREVFGQADYMVMLIIARDRTMYCRLRTNNGKFTMEQDMDVYIDYNVPFSGSNHGAWDKEYEDNVEEKKHKNFFGGFTEDISETSQGTGASLGKSGDATDENNKRDNKILEMWDRLSHYDDGEKLVLMYHDAYDIYEYEPKRRMFYGEKTAHQIDSDLIAAPEWARFVQKHHQFILELLKCSTPKPSTTQKSEIRLVPIS